MKKSNILLSHVITACVVLIFSILPAFAQYTGWVKDVTHEVGLDSARGSRIWVVDINGDNYPDLLCGTGGLNRNTIKLFLNVRDYSGLHKRRFVDFTEESGINVNRDPNKKGRIADVAAMADVDNDGDMDLVTSIYYHRLIGYFEKNNDPGDRSEVYLNDGKGRFTILPNSGLNDIVVVDTLPVGLINATGLCFMDYDLDGKLDLFIPTWWADYANEYPMLDVLLKGNGDGTFKMVAPNGSQVNNAEYGGNIVDWNNDGWPDIVTSPYCRWSGSILKNLQNGKFMPKGGSANYSAQKTTGFNKTPLCQWEAMPADYDNDGDFDLLQILMHGGYAPGEGRSVLIENMGPDDDYRFADWNMNVIKRSFPTQYYTHLGDQGGAWIDMDNDGLQDMVINTMYTGGNYGQEHSYILKQHPDNMFYDISSALGILNTTKESHSVENLDYDLDGDEDLLISHQMADTTYRDTTYNGVPKRDTLIYKWMQIILLQNDIGNKNQFVSVKLNAPKGCNGSAIGARIVVYSGGIMQTREIMAGQGHFAGQRHLVYNFGLNNFQRIDSITVRWPMMGLPVTTIYNPPMNSLLEIDSNGLKNNVILPGVDDNNTGSYFTELDLYPNPANDNINVTIPPSLNATGHIEVYNSLGIKLIEQENNNRRNLNINIQNLPSGAYLLKYTSQSGNIISKFFAVQR